MQFWPFSTPMRTVVHSPTPLNPTSTLVQLRILSFNIRYATTDPFTNEKPWQERCPLVVTQLQHETRFLDGTSPNRAHPKSSKTLAATIICLQEVLHTQLVDILASLNSVAPRSKTSENPSDGPIWAHVGVGRDDGHTKGEYSPIIYPISIFHLLHSETVWLSPTPNKPSKGWDAGSIRIITVAVLECKATGQRILASSTHLDNSGSESRKHSVGIILETLKRVETAYAQDESLPIFLAGDFNSFPTQEAYQLMARSNYVYDLRQFVEPNRRYNDGITFTGFEPEKDKDEQGRIDFIWLGPTNGVSSPDTSDETTVAAAGASGRRSWAVDGYAVLPNVFDDGVYLSDHRCVVGDVSLLA
jgi:endonuclease/exonuclease/phosphatase family metal-dependent hydrolase